MSKTHEREQKLKVELYVAQDKINRLEKELAIAEKALNKIEGVSSIDSHKCKNIAEDALLKLDRGRML